MIHFARANDAPAPRKKLIRFVGLFIALIIVAMVLTQLFTFEKYPAVLSSAYGLGDAQATVLAASIVLVELLSLPFLLRIRCSVLFRAFSSFCVWVWIVFWMIVLGSSLFDTTTQNSGLFGATFAVPPYPLVVLGWSIFTLLTALVVWGMWPRLSKPRKTGKMAN